MTLNDRFNWVESEEGNQLYCDWMRKLCDQAEKNTKTQIHLLDNGDYFVCIFPSERMKKYLAKKDPHFNSAIDANNTRIKVIFTVRDTIIEQLYAIVNRYEKGAYDGISLLTLYEAIEEAIEKDIEKKVLHAEECFFESHPE